MNVKTRGRKKNSFATRVFAFFFICKACNSKFYGSVLEVSGKLCNFVLRNNKNQLA